MGNYGNAYSDEIQDLFYVSNDEEINNFFKGLYVSDKDIFEQYSAIIVRKAFCSGIYYVNQIYLSGTDGNLLIYSKGYDSSDNAIAGLEDCVIAELNGVAFFYAIVDWNSIGLNSQVEIDISECAWNPIDDIAKNMYLVGQMQKRHNYIITNNPSSGWPLSINNRIECLGENTVVNSEENSMVSIADAPSHYAPGKENIVIEDVPCGRFCVYETTNTQYENYNIIRKKSYNPSYEKIEHKNVSISMYVDNSDTTPKFYLNDFITSAKDVILYMNGARLSSNEYEVYPLQNLIQLKCSKNDLPAGATFTCDYITEQEHFILNPTFVGVSFVENRANGNRKQFDLNGIDKGSYVNNNYNVGRHGFRPMSFIIEGCQMNDPTPFVIKTVNSVNYNGYKIECVPNPEVSNSGNSNPVLHYMHGSFGGGSDATRIESIVSRKIRTNKIITDVDFRLPSSIRGSEFKNSVVEWFTIQEYWEGRTDSLVGVDNNEGRLQRRITLSLQKLSGEDSLHFCLTVDDVPIVENGGPSSQESYKSDIVVAFDKWVSLHVEIEAGRENVGKVLVTATTDNIVQEVFRKTLRTICLAQLENNTPRPIFEDFSVMKLYTAKRSIDTYNIFSGMEMYYKNCRVDCICAIDHDA